jgi:TonB family protein
MARVPGYTFLRLDDTTADATAFGLRAGRAGGAMGTAAAVHALVILALWGLVRGQPLVQPSTRVAASPIGPFVFTSGGDTGSGRSSGGNRSADAAARLSTRGAEAIAVPVTAAPALTPPDTIAPERDPMPSIDLPVQPMAAGELPQVGAVDGVPGPPTNARGPGERGIGSKPGDDRGLGEGVGNWIGDGPHPIGNGVTAPQLIFQTRPQYTSDAMRAKIQGVALPSAVVAPDGTARNIRVVRSLDASFGLDQEAIACVRQWKFRPGTRQGKPVAVAVTIEVAFNLR